MVDAATRYFRRLFNSAFQDAEDAEAYTEEATKSFESHLIQDFQDPNQEYSISVGGRRLANEKLRIRKGSMVVEGQVQLPSLMARASKNRLQIGRG